MTEDEKFGSMPIAFEIGPFLNRIVIYDRMRLDANENLKQTSKKVTVTVQWSAKGTVRYSFPKQGGTVTATSCCQEIN